MIIDKPVAGGPCIADHLLGQLPRVRPLHVFMQLEFTSRLEDRIHVDDDDIDRFRDLRARSHNVASRPALGPAYATKKKNRDTGCPGEPNKWLSEHGGHLCIHTMVFCTVTCAIVPLPASLPLFRDNSDFRLQPGGPKPRLTAVSPRIPQACGGLGGRVGVAWGGFAGFVADSGAYPTT